MLKKYFTLATLASALVALAGCETEFTEKTAVIDGETVTYNVSPVTSQFLMPIDAAGRTTFMLRPDRLGQDNTVRAIVVRYPEPEPLARHEARTACANRGGYDGFSTRFDSQDGDKTVYLFCRN